MHHTYVGSQPIYNRDLEIHAYQLLFRNSNDNRAQFSDEDQATSELILHSLTEIGLDRLVGKHKACIKFTRNFLIGEYPIPKLKNRIIVEIQDNIEFDSEVSSALEAMAEQGFTFIMSEEIYIKHFSDKADYKCIVKFDIHNAELEKIKVIIQSISNDNVLTLADKVETQDDFIACNQLGFDYFGGFFLCQPQIVKGACVPVNKMQIIHLLHKLQDEATGIHEIEELIRTDVTLSYRLLRYANSSHLGLNTRIESIQHAVSILGQNTIKMIATLISLSKIEDKPQELFLFGLVRARMCEQLAESTNSIDKNIAFTAGLLSIIDALLDSPMENILAELPLNDELTLALLSCEGKLGHILHDVIAYINNRQDEECLSGLSDRKFCFAYVQALVWANSVADILDPTPENK